MFSSLKNRLDDLKSSLERLSPRERRMLSGLGFAVVLVLIFLVGYLIQSGLEEIEVHNQDMRQALKDLEQNKEAYLAQRRRIAAMEVRMDRSPLELTRFVEQAASTVGVNIRESVEIAPVSGDKYERRGLEIKLNKVNLDQIGRLLRELESSAHVVQITGLNIKPRFGQNQDLDVEIEVSTYERKQTKAGSAKTKSAKEST